MLSVEKGVSIHVKRFTFSVLVGAALFASLTGTSSAGWLERYNREIRVDGRPFEGRWALIDGRPWVNVESFGKALGLPRRHNVKNWYLSSQGNPKGSPFQLQVESLNGKLPTTRFGGGTFVDMQAACQAMKIPVHIDATDGVYEVGDAYRGEYMNGAWSRWYHGRRDYRGVWGSGSSKDQGHLYTPSTSRSVRNDRW